MNMLRQQQQLLMLLNHQQRGLVNQRFVNKPPTVINPLHNPLQNHLLQNKLAVHHNAAVSNILQPKQQNLNLNILQTQPTPQQTQPQVQAQLQQQVAHLKKQSVLVQQNPIHFKNHHQHHHTNKIQSSVNKNYFNHLNTQQQQQPASSLYQQQQQQTLPPPPPLPPLPSTIQKNSVGLISNRNTVQKSSRDSNTKNNSNNDSKPTSKSKDFTTVTKLSNSNVQSNRYSKGATVVPPPIASTAPQVQASTTKPELPKRPPLKSKNLSPLYKRDLKRSIEIDNDKKINGVYKLLNGAITGKIASPNVYNASTPCSENQKVLQQQMFKKMNISLNSSDFSVSSSSSDSSNPPFAKDFGSCRVKEMQFYKTKNNLPVDDNYRFRVDIESIPKNTTVDFISTIDETLDGLETCRAIESTRKSTVYPQHKSMLKNSNTITNFTNQNNQQPHQNHNNNNNHSQNQRHLSKSQTTKILTTNNNNRFNNNNNNSSYNSNYKENIPNVKRFGVVNEKNLMNRINLNATQKSILLEPLSRYAYSNSTMFRKY
jgi:hypothetical protein